jgi:uncharacterized membrane protein YhaH (DUF805 family)
MDGGGIDEAGRRRRRYWRTLGAWVLVVAGPPLGAIGAVAVMVSSQCRPDSVDCSWGLEYLLAVPVLVLCALALGPACVYAVLHRVGDPLAGSTGRWALVLALPSLVLAAVMWQTLGLPVFVLPPLVGRFLALRRAG